MNPESQQGNNAGARRYRSPLREARAAETRRAIVLAARDLFFEHGFAATSIRSIAAKAGVADSTVYVVFSDKPSILRGVLEYAVGSELSGSFEPAALLESLAAEPDPRGKLRAIARWSTETYIRGAADIEELIRDAARTDSALADLAASMEDERYRFTRMLTGLVAPGPGRPTSARLDRIAQAIWAVDSGPVYRMLVEKMGWSPSDFEEWIYRFYLRCLDDAAD